MKGKAIMEFNKSSIPNDICMKLEEHHIVVPISRYTIEKILKTIFAGTSFALLKLILIPMEIIIYLL